MHNHHAPKLAIIVLAAGEGTRMRSALPKVLHPLCGRSMLEHVLAATDTLDATLTCIVLAQDTLEQVRSQCGQHNQAGRPYMYVVQSERRGTGHAVMQTRTMLKHHNLDQVLVLFGDTPLLRSHTAQAVVEQHRQNGAVLTMLSFRPHSPTGYGRVLRNQAGQVYGIVEERDATAEQRAIGEVNSGIMCIQADWLWKALDQLQPSPVKGEYYLTDLVALAVAEHGPGSILAVEAHDEREAWGINNRVQLAQAEAVLRAWLLEAIMLSGVTVVDPQATYVDIGVTVGQDTTLFPGSCLFGKSHVGADCQIGPATTLRDAVIGDRTRIQHALVENRHVPPDSLINGECLREF